MKESYIVSIERPGMADAPELCRCQSIDAAVAVVRALLSTGDEQIRSVKVTIGRSITQERAA